MRLTHRRAVFTYKTLTRSSLSLAGRQCVPETRSTPAVIECVCMCATPVTSTNARRVPLLSMLPHFDLFFGGKSLCTRFVFTVVFCVCVCVRALLLCDVLYGGIPASRSAARMHSAAFQIRRHTHTHTPAYKTQCTAMDKLCWQGKAFCCASTAHTHTHFGRQTGCAVAVVHCGEPFSST